MSRIRLTRRAGQPGTKKLMRQYGQDLICVRYRYDEEMRQRIKTVEIAIDRAKWEVQIPNSDDAQVVYFRIEDGEDLLRRAVLHAGGRELVERARAYSSVWLRMWDWLDKELSATRGAEDQPAYEDSRFPYPQLTDSLVADAEREYREEFAKLYSELKIKRP